MQVAAKGLLHCLVRACQLLTWKGPIPEQAMFLAHKDLVVHTKHSAEEVPTRHHHKGMVGGCTVATNSLVIHHLLLVAACLQQLSAACTAG